nr:EOG090X0DZ9 [Cyclestheria hislopi]
MAFAKFAKASFLTPLTKISRNLALIESRSISATSDHSVVRNQQEKWSRSCTRNPNERPTRRHFHGSSPLLKREDRREMLASMPRMDEGTEGEKYVDIDATIGEHKEVFVDEKTPDLLFEGVRFADLPICNITATPNNTIITLTTATGKVKLLRSCGIEGFKNTRKGTNIAAQATATTLATKAVEQGYSNVRVTVSGLGPGRMSSVKGLTMGGLNVISITDCTPVSWNSTPRPKKQRKL